MIFQCPMSNAFSECMLCCCRRGHCCCCQPRAHFGPFFDGGRVLAGGLIVRNRNMKDWLGLGRHRRTGPRLCYPTNPCPSASLSLQHALSLILHSSNEPPHSSSVPPPSSAPAAPSSSSQQLATSAATKPSAALPLSLSGASVAAEAAKKVRCVALPAVTSWAVSSCSLLSCLPSGTRLLQHSTPELPLHLMQRAARLLTH